MKKLISLSAPKCIGTYHKEVAQEHTPWTAQIQIGKITKQLGCFATETEASNAVTVAINKNKVFAQN